MKKIKLVLKATLFCLAAALSMGLAQAGTGTTNLLQNWSFELPGTGKITTGYDTIPYWFSRAIAFDSGVESGEVPPDGSTWCAYMDATNADVRANQTTTHIIQTNECFIASIWIKNEWIWTVGYQHTNGYVSVVLYYGGTPDVVVNGVSGPYNETLGTVGTPFFTNTFEILPGSASHTTETDWTNYVFGVISDWIPTNAIGQPIGIQFWNSSTQYNNAVDGTKAWMELDDVQLFATNGIAPILSPVGLTPTNSVWGGDTLTFSESAFGSLPLTYQWQTDGGGGGSMTNIVGATLTNLVVVTSTNPGTYNYQVIVTNSYGMATSGVASYVVMGLTPPSLTRGTGTAEFGTITNIVGFIGGYVDLYAAFLGAPPVTNQWLVKLDSGGGYTNIAGATGWGWTVTNVQSAKTGNYYLGATNAFGSINSTPTHLTALADPAAPGSLGVTNMYANDVMTNHPWAYWKFEETNDTFFQSMQAYDYSGHNYNATYGNSDDGTMATGCKDGGESLPDLGPIPNNSYSGFPVNNMTAKMSANHDNGYLRLPPLNLNTNTVTFTMWIKPNVSTLPLNTGLLMNRNGVDAAGIGFGSTTNGAHMPCLAYTWNTNGSATYGWNSGLFPVAGVWNFVACVISPANTTMYLYYVNGSTTNLSKNTHLGSTNAPESFSGGTTWLGSDNWNNGNTFNGWIDEVAIFTNAMSEGQIQDLFLKALGMNNGIAPVFTQQPTNVAVFQGQTLQLSALATGIPSPATNSQYTWQDITATVTNNLATALPSRLTTNATFYWQYFNGAFTNYRCIATNGAGKATSSVAQVTFVPSPTNAGLWTMNFCVPSAANTGPNTPYVGPGVLASTNTTAYWNALQGGNMQNATGLLDDGVTPSGVKVSATNGYLGTFCSGVPCNNLLLDQYCQIMDTNNGLNFFFTQVPRGIYNLALYGCTASYANRGVGFTVITNGVIAGATQWVTNNLWNAGDLSFTPYDNTVVFTNLLVVNGKLQVNASIARAVPLYTNSTEADFNGAQLQLVTAGPDIWSCATKGTNVVLRWGGGGLQQSTNLTPGVGSGWVTNTAVSPYTFAPTGAVRFFRVVNGAPHWP